MKKNSLTTAVVAGIAGVAGFAGLANAVHLNPDGLGQVLLYPYYTVMDGQQTLLSVVNTAGVAKAVKVRFLEGYNTREVLDFNLFLSPYDVWTATIFNLVDAGKTEQRGGIFTTDKSCTAPLFTTSGVTFGANNTPYVPFVNFAYASTNADGGPAGLTRTREGHFEIISMADITTGSALANAVKHSAAGVPANCGAVQADSIIGNAAFVAPTSGLFGGAAVIDTAEGTMYSYNADALDQFTAVQLFTGTANVLPNLASVNDTFLGSAATAHVFTGTGVTTSTYGGPGVTASRPVDAVSAIFSANAIYNEYVTSASIGADSDWVVTFPTKSFYVDPLFAGSSTVARAPFEEIFRNGQSCVTIGLTIFDREERTETITQGFSPPPPGDPDSTLCKEVNVISFIATDVAPTASNVLGSTLVSNVKPIIGANGWLKLDLNKNSNHNLPAATNNGNVWRGLPVSGFWASNFVNNNAATIGGVSVLSNYSGVFKHRVSRDCIRTGQLACS